MSSSSSTAVMLPTLALGLQHRGRFQADDTHVRSPRCSAAREVSSAASTREPSLERGVAASSQVDGHELTRRLADLGAKCRWADMLSDSSGEDDEEFFAGPHVATSSVQVPVPAGAAASRPRWADLLSESEGELTPKARVETSSASTVTPEVPKPRWADMTSESDEEEMKVEVRPMDNMSKLSASTRKQKQDTSSTSNSGAVVAPARKEKAQRGSYEASQGRRARQTWNSRGSEVPQKAWEQRRNEASTRGGSHSGWQAAKRSQPAAAAAWSQNTWSKRQCQFVIGIEEEASFRVCRRLLGSGGEHVKRFAQTTGAKLRLRGRGSKFLEGPENLEADEPLMLCISAPDPDAYSRVFSMVSEHLERIYGDYHRFCTKQGLLIPRVTLDFHEGAREGGR